MEAAEHFAVLGVPTDASLEQIRAAYQARLHDLRVATMSGVAPPADRIARLRTAFIVVSDAVARSLEEPPMPAGTPPRSEPVANEATPPAEAALANSSNLVEALASPGLGEADSEMQDVQKPESATFRVSFAGSGAEYFRVWIVNLMLTLATLGIYSVWAKVRREQYFHRALVLDGSSFAYHGTPAAIFRGRALAVVMFSALSAAEHFSTSAYGGLLLLLTPLVPWFAVRAFRFRAHNTSYRGIRFAFHGTYREAMTALIGYGVLTLLTCGLTYPYWYAKMRLFVFNNLSYGRARLSSRSNAGEISSALLKPMLLGGVMFVALGIVMLFVTFALATAFFAVLSGVVSSGPPAVAVHAPAIKDLAKPAGFMVMVAYVVFYAQFMRAMFAARSAKLLLDGASVGGARIQSDLDVGTCIVLALKNLLLIVLTLGLYAPYARVRMARYRAVTLSVTLSGGLEAFVAGEDAKSGALGDETSEIFDLDIGL